ncbi:hypothetical protein [Streptomyces griseorubiginosus]|uniref:hypothetical protein n=1 Tax=Streptomyces griseorubiginosus TaxID=67304 RepID=UPI002E8216B2|nr:hypothetical protein [Streptomyces griseorubiginosus]WUB46450.1 hypothetical protein OHN19_25200 [Streptomyces griseorubiginosus]WUB54971.1 hypothetical protein OG942_25205 [Streptomyces griseorubiginosus]
MHDHELRDDELWQLLEEDEPLKSSIDVLVSPNRSRALSLGTYSQDTLDPDFSHTYSPQDTEDQMGLSFSRVDIPGKPKYKMLAFLHNYGSKPCTVKIWRTEDATTKA